MRRFKSEDGYVFHEQPDGTLTDNPDPALADMTFSSLAELQADSEVEEISETEETGGAEDADPLFVQMSGRGVRRPDGPSLEPSPEASDVKPESRGPEELNLDSQVARRLRND